MAEKSGRMRLEIELIPKTSHFTNVRSEFPEKWDELRRACYKAAGYRCEICGGKGDRWPVECHEVWDYNKKSLTQKLVRLIALCPNCHKVKHWGLSELRGERNLVMKHFCRVNGISEDEAEKKVQKAFDLYRLRSAFHWKLDMSILEGAQRGEKGGD